MQTGAPAYEIIEHTADIGVRVRAVSLNQLFETAAAAMFEIMIDGGREKPAIEREFTCKRDSLEELLVEWLGSLLYVFDTERVVFSRFSVELDGNILLARAAGEPFDDGRHAPRVLIKAVTYHALTVSENAGGYEATVIFDA